MKKLLFIAIAFICISASAQTSIDSAITLTVTKQTLWIYGDFQNQSPNWDNRKLPDEVSTALGTNKKTNPDSLVTFTFKRGTQLVKFIGFIESQKIGAFVDFYRKVYLGNPTITNFGGGLKAQINTMSALNTQQGRTALEVKAAAKAYEDDLDKSFTDSENRGIDWIKN